MPTGGSVVAKVWRMLLTLAFSSALLGGAALLGWKQLQPKLQSLAGFQPVPSPTERCDHASLPVSAHQQVSIHACASHYHPRVHCIHCRAGMAHCLLNVESERQYNTCITSYIIVTILPCSEVHVLCQVRVYSVGSAIDSHRHLLAMCPRAS